MVALQFVSGRVDCYRRQGQMAEIKVTKVDEAKQSYHPYTSEALLSLSEPPAYQCDNITDLVNKVKSIESEIDRAHDYLRDEEYEDAEHHASSALWDIRDVSNEIESLREQIELVRAWGQEWKDLAKKMLNDETLDNFTKHVGLSIEEIRNN